MRDNFTRMNLPNFNHFRLFLAGILLGGCSAASVNNNGRISMYQTAMLFSAEPRAVGPVLDLDKTSVEASYARAFTKMGPPRVAMGDAAHVVVDSLSARFARGVHTGLELSLQLDLALSSRAVASDVSQDALRGRTAWGASVALRGIPVRKGSAALVLQTEVGTAHAPVERQTVIEPLTPGEFKTVTKNEQSDTSALHVTMAVSGLFQAGKLWTFQVGAAGGINPYVKGHAKVGANCDQGSCYALDEENVVVLSGRLDLIPFASAVFKLGPVDLLASGWVMAASMQDGPVAVPGGVRAGVRVVF